MISFLQVKLASPQDSCKSCIPAFVEKFDRICICNRMRPSRIKDKFSRVFSKFSQNCPSRVATRAICENFETTSENLSLILRGLNAITCL